jgi:ABC-type transporter MlaC component
MLRWVIVLIVLSVALAGHAVGQSQSADRPCQAAPTAQPAEPRFSVTIPRAADISAAIELAARTAGSNLTEAQRQQLTQVFVPIIHRAFDTTFNPTTLTQLAIGPAWSGFTEAQRQQVTVALARYISVILAEHLDSYSGGRIELIGTQRTPGGVSIMSRVSKPDGKSVRIDILLQERGDSWLIGDIYLDGTYSVVTTLRDEFNAILRSRGVDGLIAALNDKATALGSSRTPR